MLWKMREKLLSLHIYNERHTVWTKKIKFGKVCLSLLFRLKNDQKKKYIKKLKVEIKNYKETMFLILYTNINYITKNPIKGFV